MSKRKKPCHFCEGGRVAYQETNHTKLFISRFGKVAVLETMVNCCPPHAKCSDKGISRNSAFIINYCPECGRKLGE